MQEAVTALKDTTARELVLSEDQNLGKEKANAGKWILLRRCTIDLLES